MLQDKTPEKKKAPSARSKTEKSRANQDRTITDKIGEEQSMTRQGQAQDHQAQQPRTVSEGLRCSQRAQTQAATGSDPQLFAQDTQILTYGRTAQL